MNETTSGAGSLAWVEIALIIFFVVFVLITIGVFLRKRGHYDRAAQIPLNDLPSDTPDDRMGAAS